MKRWIAVVACALAAGCGLETAGTAATGAQIKKQELEEGKRTQARAQQKIDEATQQMHQRAGKAADSDSK